MVQKRKPPRRKPKKRGWSPVGPPTLAGRICRPRGPRVAPLGKKGSTRRARKAVTIGLVRGEVKSVATWIGNLATVMASVKPEKRALTTITKRPVDTPPVSMVGRLCLRPGDTPPVSMVGRLCGPLPWEVRPLDLVQLLDALQKETNAIVRQLGLLEKKFEVRRPPRPAPRR